jgi:hypothetical protein
VSQECGIVLNHPVEAMRLTLVYDGELPSTSHADTTDKMKLRRAFHRQLDQVWQRKLMLQQFMENWRAWIDSVGSKDRWSALTDQERNVREANSLVIPFIRGDFCFVPIVTKRHHLVCELDILFLRAEKPGSLFDTNTAGDLDNRLKILLDALRVPKQGNQLPATDAPQHGEDPFLCLLEDDDLITSIRIESERLYEPSDRQHLENNVRLTIRATIKAQEFSHLTLHAVAD